MCQKAVGGLFAALSKVKLADFAWTRGQPGAFRSSSAAERHFCASCGTPLTFHYLNGDAIEVTTGSLDEPVRVPIVKNFSVDTRLPWIDRLMPGALPEVPPSNPVLTSFQHPDHDANMTKPQPERYTMTLREQFTDRLKIAMKGGDAATTSTVRMIMAKLKDTDIASRPKGIDKVPDEEIVAMLRGMAKSRRESIELYKQGNRPELVAKEEAEIVVIEAFLPQQMDDAAMRAAVAEAVQETGAASIKDMGKVMAALKAKHAATLDMGKAGPMVKAALSA
jgi:uncharacterized protein YqeY